MCDSRKYSLFYETTPVMNTYEVYIWHFSDNAGLVLLMQYCPFNVVVSDNFNEDFANNIDQLHVPLYAVLPLVLHYNNGHLICCSRGFIFGLWSANPSVGKRKLYTYQGFFYNVGIYRWSAVEAHPMYILFVRTIVLADDVYVYTQLPHTTQVDTFQCHSM